MRKLVIQMQHNNKTRRFSYVIKKIMNDDYTLSERDFYPPEDNRCLESNLDDTYDGKKNAFEKYCNDFNDRYDNDDYLDFEN